MLRALLIILLLMTRFSGIGQVVNHLDAERFEKKLKETQTPVLLDVRTQNEYKSGHLNQAQLMDLNSSDFKTKASKLDKSKPVFVYCAAGVRSDKAATILKDMGFKQIYDLTGGIRAWSQAGYPIIK